MEFVEINIRRTPGAIEKLAEMGVMATPALVIGSRVLAGFDPAEIEQALENLS